VEFFFSHRPDHLPKIAQLVLLLVPDPHFMQVGMAVKQSFVYLSNHEIDLGVGKCCMQFLKNGSSQHNVSDKSSLNDQDFLHAQQIYNNQQLWTEDFGFTLPCPPDHG